MSTPRVFALLPLLIALLMVGSPASRARADPPQIPSGGSFRLDGRGYGHGWGMSQYGAYGAARQGLSWRQIVGFYYPGTTISSQVIRTPINVWISADTDQNLTFLPNAGQSVTDDRGTTFDLPAAAVHTQWRITRVSGKLTLASRNSSGTWTTQRTTLATTGTWTVQAAPSWITKVVLPNGSITEYRGQTKLVPYGSGSRTVNRVMTGDYLRSVVPSEMPTSWHAEAVRSQVVAARTYAARLKSQAGTGAAHDVCDTIACQVYKGAATTSGGKRTVHETAAGDAAVAATAGSVLTHNGALALTQFSSSNGGHSAKGDFSYLPAKPDPYDGVVQNQSWQVTVTAAQLQRAYPAAGTVRSVQITARDGAGAWGGRVTQIRISGSAGTVTATGAAFRSALGLRSALFTVTGEKQYQTFPRHYTSSTDADLVIITKWGTVQRRPVTGAGSVGELQNMTSVGTTDAVAHAGDWNGDSRQDLLVQTANHRLVLRPGGATGTVGSAVDLGVSSYNVSITSPGDWDGDGLPDVITLSTGGNLWLVRGSGASGTKGAVQLGRNWGDRDFVISPGDWTGDGRPDLISRKGDGLYVHPGDHNGFTAPKLISNGWSGKEVGTIGDFSGDGKPDLLSRSGSKITIHRGNGAGGISGTATLSQGFADARFPG